MLKWSLNYCAAAVFVFAFRQVRFVNDPTMDETSDLFIRFLHDLATNI